MTRGRLYGDRYSLKWLNHDQHLTFGFAMGGVTIGSPTTLMSRPHASGYRCVSCKKIVVDEDTWD
jgi:hypothetical protein